MLKVTVAEVQRDVIKQLGIDLSGSFNYGTAVVNFNTTNPFSASGQALSDTPHRRQLRRTSPPRCARWSAPASSARWPSRT